MPNVVCRSVGYYRPTHALLTSYIHNHTKERSFSAAAVARPSASFGARPATDDSIAVNVLL